MNVATYIKFDDITSAQVEVKPSRLVPTATGEPLGNNLQRDNLRPLGSQQLDGSFNPLMTLSGALDKLQPTSGQQTPALGKCTDR